MNLLARVLPAFATAWLVSPCLAEIDSGGGSSTVGALTNYSSLGSPFATDNVAVGSNELRGGLVQVLFSATATLNPDVDGNGLPDDWENQYFPTQASVDPLADADGDGCSNLMEYLAGTNPTDRSSRFNPQGSLTGNTYTLPIQTAVGRNYKVYATRDLATWTLQQTYTGDGSLKTFSFDETAVASGPLHSATHPSRYFFRVEVVLP